MKGRDVFWICPVVALAICLPTMGIAEVLETVAESPQVQKQRGAFWQGVEHYQQGNYEEALENLQKADETKPKNAVIHYYLGLTYKGMLRYPEAEASLIRATELDASQGTFYSFLGGVLYRLGKYEKATRALEEAEAKGARSAYTAYMKGLTLIELAEYNNAIKALKRAQKLDPEYKQKTSYAIGIIHTRQHDMQAAELAFKNAIAINPESDTGVFATMGLKLVDEPKKSPFHLDFEYGFHYDDNVVLKPSKAVSGVFPQGENDFTHVFSLHAGYKPDLGKTFGLRADVTYYKSIHQKLSQMNVDGVSFSFTPSVTTDWGTLSLEGRTEYYLVGFHRYLNINGVYPNFGFSFGKMNQGVLHGGFQSKQFMQPSLIPAENRDARNYSAGYSHYIHSEDYNSYIGIDYTYDMEDSVGGNWDYNGHRVAISASYPFGNGFGLRFNGDYYLQYYRNRNSVFGVKRKDKVTTITPILTYSLGWSDLLLQYTRVDSKSNVSAYEYSRNIMGVGFEYSY